LKFCPYRDGWQCFEEGFAPYWTGERAKKDAIGYATARAKFGGCEIRGLNAANEVLETFLNPSEAFRSIS
jgi:hypothetical protein